MFGLRYIYKHYGAQWSTTIKFLVSCTKKLKDIWSLKHVHSINVSATHSENCCDNF